MMNYFYYDSRIKYPNGPTYGPDTEYPECPFQEDLMQGGENYVYRSLRESFFNMGMDAVNYGTSKWNPFGEWIVPGDIVLIKPNMVMDHNPAEKDLLRGMECTVTHPSIVRTVFDYVVIALKGKGTIIIADAPVQGCDFEKMKKNSGYDTLFEFIRAKIPSGIELVTGDFRETIFQINGNDVSQNDNLDSIYRGQIINIGDESYFARYEGTDRLRVTDYDGTETVKHHTDGKNEYCFNLGALKANVVLNLCKPKTHRIAGYTGAMKNIIGMNARKEYLPHHTKGCKSKGGDEYSDGHLLVKKINSDMNDLKNASLKMKRNRLWWMFNRFAAKAGRYLDKKEKNRNKFGMWYGNDTIWRTILDINNIITYYDEFGERHDNPIRRIINIGDMIVSGEKEGPLQPSYKYVGGILLSDNAVAFDYILVRLMGFDPGLLPTLSNAMMDERLLRSHSLYTYSNDERFCGNPDEFKMNFSFVPTAGWNDVLGKG